MIRHRWFSALAGVALAALAPLTARAEVPPALDRAPAGAPVVISIKNVSQFVDVIASFQSLGIPMEGMDHVKQMLKTPGLNADGSAAIVMIGGKDEDDSGALVIAPVTDFGAMVKALGGEAGSGIRQIKIEDQTLYCKDISGGFAAVAKDKAALDKFDGKAGNGPAYEKLMGAAGRASADGAHMAVIADIQGNADKIKAGVEELKTNLEMMAMMSGGKIDTAAIGQALDNIVKDGSAFVLGFRKAETGMRVDATLQFKDGTESAGGLSSPGKAGALTGTIPNTPFLFAASIDTSSPAIRKIFVKMMEQQKAAGGDALAGLNPLKTIEKIDGASFVLGTPPSIMNGLLLNTAAFVKTSDPAGYVATLKSMISTLNGKEMDGISYQTTYEAGGGKAGDKAVDLWSLKMQVDDNNPAAEQVKQMQSVLFGMGKLTGFIAPTANGVVVTYSKNSALLQQSLDAAGGTGGLNQDKGVRTISENLPADRAAEAFIGTKSILEVVTPFMGQFNFQVPDDLPPIGLAVTTTGGGARFTAFMPQSVIETLAKLGKAASGEDEPEKAPSKKDKTGQPKF